MNCFCLGRPRLNKLKEMIMEYKGQLIKDALDGLGGVNQSSRVRPDLIIYDP